MKAVVYDRYGGPEVLSIAEVAIPSPGQTQVLVRVHATSVNLSDWECLQGTPLYARIGGLRSPARQVLGSDIAGRVEAVGSGVTRFRPGDEVYGDNLDLKGGFAEYAVASESALALEPESLTFAEASTLPQAAAIALQGTAGAGPGKSVLINGAGGGSGSFAIQLAKSAGAHVTGVDNVCRTLRPRARPRRAPFGIRVSQGARSRRSVPLCRRDHAGVAASCDGRCTHRDDDRPPRGVLAVKLGPAHFTPIAERHAAGHVDIHIDRRFALDEVSEALAHVGEGHALGKVVVEIARERGTARATGKSPV
ncbi:NAD(P)-dependent alcohol dehydrogenase [Nocardia abscessus]|uniref:NAD(P)-dependent alcohol dehydrogenase n=1 Tax=Nocardia abscessus TaxID=120957 RepID=UPI0024575062|nr:NAD(P)-dependent alcohol dehydrogenase [Nocardia abscessus]